jgi:hypothetical protein
LNESLSGKLFSCCFIYHFWSTEISLKFLKCVPEMGSGHTNQLNSKQITFKNTPIEGLYWTFRYQKERYRKIGVKTKTNN